jgi:hypothetical protein
MKTTVLLTNLLIISGLLSAYLAVVTPIWLSPTNITILLPNPPVNLPEYADAPKGEWVHLDFGAGQRTLRSIFELDSKGIFWLISGYDDVYWKNAVWNYDPETDLYRWAAGKVDEPSNNFLARGDFGIPSPDVFPGGAVSWSATTIDHNDNIWIYGADYSPQYEFWRLNTTSLEFTYFGMNNNVRAAVGGDKGVPSTTTYPGHVEAGALFVDSQNNLWLFGGFYNNTTNTVWHFNTTSYMWTWVWGEVNTFVQP